MPRQHNDPGAGAEKGRRHLGHEFLKAIRLFVVASRIDPSVFRQRLAFAFCVLLRVHCLMPAESPKGSPFERVPEPYRSEALGIHNSLALDGLAGSEESTVRWMEARLAAGEMENRKRAIQEREKRDGPVPFLLKVKGTPLPRW